MGDFHLLSLLMLGSAFILLCFCMRLFYTIWWRPMKLQTHLRQQGIPGHPYKFLYGNIKDNMRSLRQSQSKPIDLTHQIASRVVPFFHQTAKDYGMYSLSLGNFSLYISSLFLRFWCALCRMGFRGLGLTICSDRSNQPRPESSVFVFLLGLGPSMA